MEKGEYGYRTHYKKKMGTMIALFLIAIVIQYIASKLSDVQSIQNILTVTAILTVLPMANLAAPYLAVWKYRTPDQMQKNEVMKYSKNNLMLYDLIITFQEMILPIDYCLIGKEQVLMYLSRKGQDTKEAIKRIEENLRQNHFTYKIHLYDEFDVFMLKLKECSFEQDDFQNVGDVGNILKSLSV